MSDPDFYGSRYPFHTLLKAFIARMVKSDTTNERPFPKRNLIGNYTVKIENDTLRNPLQKYMVIVQFISDRKSFEIFRDTIAPIYKQQSA